jgi:hypothetical protein
LGISNFAPCFGRENPKEDFAECFATYWLHRLELDSYFGENHDEELLEKMSNIDAFVSSITT